MPRNFRKADTGVSQSAMKLWRKGIRLYPSTSARARSRLGSIWTAAILSGTSGALGATGIEHPLGVGERASTAVQEHEQVIDQVGRLFVDALI